MRDRRIGEGLSQSEISERSGVPLRTGKRLEGEGDGSLRHVIQAAITLRCEDNLALLFPAPAASSLDELLARQSVSATPKRPSRAPRRRARVTPRVGP
ncbi:MAG TPA: XRE family transcriptional regulator [Caulobacteraceae bacterium]|nr:XRE family transcriptional regulator [Caulobacteraceae bacterium]